MQMGFLELLAIVLTTAVFVSVAGLVLTSLATRTWRELKGRRPDPAGSDVLDRLDRIEIQLSALSERLRASDPPTLDDESDEDRADGPSLPPGSQ